ncbi:hypothetical protein Zmor_028346 [Zophobas morio]|uniref:Uncharacterized protein n=1 Tax=Zophobas morio TaxID=2755281 RepID=A0AA38HRZ1_9CUCU|nr:hypothetical protein Zmor_028346 [Zophobas morio]
MHVPDNDENLTHDISLQEVESRIKYLKNSKAPGPDQIKATLLKKPSANSPSSSDQHLQFLSKRVVFPDFMETSLHNYDLQTRKRLHSPIAQFPY